MDIVFYNEIETWDELDEVKAKILQALESDLRVFVKIETLKA